MKESIYYIFELIPFHWTYFCDVPEKIIDLVLKKLHEENVYVTEARADEDGGYATAGGICFELYDNGLCLAEKTDDSLTEVFMPSIISVNGREYYVYGIYFTQELRSVRKLYLPRTLYSISEDTIPNLPNLETVECEDGGYFVVEDNVLYGSRCGWTAYYLIWFPNNYSRPVFKVNPEVQKIYETAFCHVKHLPDFAEYPPKISDECVMIDKSRSLLLGHDSNVYQIVGLEEMKDASGKKPDRIGRVALRKISGQPKSLHIYREGPRGYSWIGASFNIDYRHWYVDVAGINLETPCESVTEIYLHEYDEIPYVFVRDPRMLPNLRKIELVPPVKKEPYAIEDDEEDRTYLARLLVNYDGARDVDGVLYDQEMKTLLQYPRKRKDESFEVREGVEEIGEYAFFGTRNLRHVKLPSTLRKIGIKAFRASCIDEIDIPESVRVIDDYAFDRCRHLKELVIPEGVTDLSPWAVEKCRALERVVIKAPLLKIEGFNNCRKLKYVEFPETMVLIGPNSFEGCSSLEELRFPKSLLFIDYWTFAECRSLERVVGDENVMYLGSCAFHDCPRFQIEDFFPSLNRDLEGSVRIEPD